MQLRLGTDCDGAAVAHNDSATQCGHIELTLKAIDDDQFTTSHRDLHPLTAAYFKQY